MGHKTHPTGFRLGYIKHADSRWFAKKDYRKFLHEDLKIRKFLKERLYHSGIAKIEIERMLGKININIHTARPGIVIGRKGTEVENLKQELNRFTTMDIYLNILEVRKPEINAQLVAENVAMQLERRIAFRRAMKKAVAQALKSGAQGVKILCSGRLGGAEMARTEWYREGRVPLQTLRADIEYGYAIAATTYGHTGVKTWVFQGEVLPAKKEAPPRA